MHSDFTKRSESQPMAFTHSCLLTHESVPFPPTFPLIQTMVALLVIPTLKSRNCFQACQETGYQLLVSIQGMLAVLVLHHGGLLLIIVTRSIEVKGVPVEAIENGKEYGKQNQEEPVELLVALLSHLSLGQLLLFNSLFIWCVLEQSRPAILCHLILQTIMGYFQFTLSLNIARYNKINFNIIIDPNSPNECVNFHHCPLKSRLWTPLFYLAQIRTIIAFHVTYATIHLKRLVQGTYWC